MKNIFATFSILIVLSITACGYAPKENIKHSGGGNYDEFISEFQSTPLYNGIAYLGDSITVACYYYYPEYFIGKEHNRGITGASSDQILLLINDVIIKEHPESVSILIGTVDIFNNNISNYQKNINLIIRQLQNNIPGVMITLNSILPTHMHYEFQIESFNQVLKNAAKNYHNVEYRDVYDLFKQNNSIDESLYDDEIHLNRQGCIKLFN